MRTPLIAGNWKMNTTRQESTALVAGIVQALASLKGAEVVLCPPYPWLSLAKDQLAGATIKLGAQNVHQEEKGAFTGEVSIGMLAGLCDYVIIGHSERRQYFQETDALVNKKAKLALKAGVRPIVCVGERAEERQAAQTEAVITRQVRGALDGVANTDALAFAYEPVWAIGSGTPATSAQAQEVAVLIRRLLAAQFGASAAQGVRILYGGSVTDQNISEFMRQPDIDGGLIGGASLKADVFVNLVKRAVETKLSI